MCQLWPCNAEMKWQKIISYFSFLQGRKIMSRRISLQAFRNLKGGHSTLGLKHICVTKKGRRAGKHATAVTMLKRSIELKVLPSNAGETGEEAVGQVIATRGEKESCAGVLDGFCMEPGNRPHVESGTCADSCMQWVTQEVKVLQATQASLKIPGQTIWSCSSPCSATLYRALVGHTGCLGAEIWVFLRRQTAQRLARGQMALVLLVPMHCHDAWAPKKELERAEIPDSSACTLKLHTDLGNCLIVSN